MIKISQEIVWQNDEISSVIKIIRSLLVIVQGRIINDGMKDQEDNLSHNKHDYNDDGDE